MVQHAILYCIFTNTAKYFEDYFKVVLNLIVLIIVGNLFISLTRI